MELLACSRRETFTTKTQKQEGKNVRKNSRKTDPRIFKLDFLGIPSSVVFRGQPLHSNWSLESETENALSLYFTWNVVRGAYQSKTYQTPKLISPHNKSEFGVKKVTDLLITAWKWRSEFEETSCSIDTDHCRWINNAADSRRTQKFTAVLYAHSNSTSSFLIWSFRNRVM